MPFFSIIIPTYDSGNTLQKCLKSIVKQNFPDFEILIIDGISQDGTLKIAESFNDSRINIFSEKDQGIYDAMNKGIDKSNGEWLYFLGSDDELNAENVLEKIYATVKTTKNKIIYGTVKIVGDAGWAKDGDIYDGKFDLKKLLKKNICHQAIFYNKSVYQNLGKYNIGYKICADWDFNLKCFANYDLKYIDMIVARFQAGNVSSISGDEKFREDKWLNIVKYFKWKLLKREFLSYFLNRYKKSLLTNSIN